MSAGTVCRLRAALGPPCGSRPFPWPVARSAAGPGAAPGAAGGSELGQLGAGRRDPDLLRAEVDDQGGVILNAHDPAEAVLVVSYLVLLGELLGRRGCGRALEGA